MSQPELLRRVVQVLQAGGIDYMVTSSLASSMQGEPRSTHDLDLVVDLPADAAARLVEAFPPPDFYLSSDAVTEALRSRTMFNLLSIADGEKVDFWVLTDGPFDRSRFARKRLEPVFGMALNVSAPEDTILAKLRWAKRAGGSDKQFTDALRVYEVQAQILDKAYLEHWAGQLGVEELWAQLRTQAEAL